jgi:hypothetical protein
MGEFHHFSTNPSMPVLEEQWVRKPPSQRKRQWHNDNQANEGLIV